MTDTRGAAPAYVPATVKFGYSAGLFGISLVQTSVVVLLILFYVDILGLSPATAGLILFFGTFFDAIASMAAAWTAAHQRGARGRYRPILIAVAGPLALCFALLFTRPPLPADIMWLWAIVLYLCYRICYAFTLTPHSAMISCLSPDADERAAVGAWKAVANNLGLMAAGYLGMGTIERLGRSDPARGFLVFGLVFGTIAGASVLMSALMTRERPTAAGAAPDTADLLPALGLILRNGQMLAVLAATLAFFAAYTLLSGSIVYLFRYLTSAPQGAKLAVLMIGAAGLVTPPLWTGLIRRSSKAKVWAAGCITIAAAFLLLYATGMTALGPLMTLFFAVGAGKSAVIVNFYAMTADAVDHGQWLQGRRVEAYAFGMLALANKVGTAVGGGLLGLLLSWSGIVAKSAAPPDIDRLWLAVCAAPALFAAASAGLALLFRVDAARHRALLADMAGRRIAANEG